MSGLRAENFDLLGTGRVALQRRSPRARSSRLGGSCAPVSLATRNPQPATCTAFTLIEVLIVITIIATLSAAFLGVSGAAMEGSREARTKTTIGKINTLLMEKWASYSTRRVDVDPTIESNFRASVLRVFSTSHAAQAKALGTIRANVRLIALRELMALEMPDSWSDVLLHPVNNDREVNSTNATEPRVLGAYPPIWRIYLRRYQEVFDNNPPNVTGNIEKILANQSAECLYMIIMLTTGDGEARSSFGDREIGDVDNDGAPEFLDGWGRPISFIRWPAGFAEKSDLMLGDAAIDHDPSDVFRRDVNRNNDWPPVSVYRAEDDNYIVNYSWILELSDQTPAFRLLPLIYSAGPDGVTDINDQAYTGSANPVPSSLDPYAVNPDTNDYVFGIPTDLNNDGEDNSIDNIHNHLLDNR